MASFAWLCQYVLSNTSTRWIYISDDDILINFHLLPAFMNGLDRAFDLLHQIVVRGDCIMNGPVYPQGGSGVILSRFAVEKLAPYGSYSVWGFRESCPDQRLGRAMNRVFSGTAWYTSMGFLGSLYPSDFQMLRECDFVRLRRCPNSGTLSQIGCSRFVAPLRETVFFHIGTVFHNGPGWLKQRLAIASDLWNAPPQVSVWPWNHVGSKHMCLDHKQNSTHLW
jgi:hypothetical protein